MLVRHCSQNPLTCNFMFGDVRQQPLDAVPKLRHRVCRRRISALESALGCGGAQLGDTARVNRLVVRRIAVIGPVGAGKTTLACRIGVLASLPVTDLDDVFWRSVPVPTDEAWRTIHDGLLQGDGLVIAGDYRATAGTRFAAADTVVWLDLSVARCAFRTVRRKLQGNPAPLLSCLHWILRYPRRGRKETEAALLVSSTVEVHRLRTPQQVQLFLDHFAAGGACTGTCAEPPSTANISGVV